MSTNRVPDHVIDQLRGNLRAAGIPAAEADIQGIVAKGFLSRLADIERVIAQSPIEIVPDYLAVWDDAPTPIEPRQIGAAYHSSPIADVAAELRARRISPIELTEQALTRIAARDPELNAFQLVLAEPARAAARRAEQELAAGAGRGPPPGGPGGVQGFLGITRPPPTPPPRNPVRPNNP